MSDFFMQAGFHRDQMADALTDNPEHLMYVLGCIADTLEETTSFYEMIEHHEQVMDKERFAKFFTDLAKQVRDA